MSSKSFNQVLTLRPWTLDDTLFSLRVRNCPQLMKYFRQDEPISLAVQQDFIRKDRSFSGEYNGMVIEADGEMVGLCGVKSTGEFTLGILPEHQHKGIATWAMQQLIKTHKNIWSEVFVGNPALEWFISVLGFKITGIKERAYYKQDVGMIDIVRIAIEQ